MPRNAKRSYAVVWTNDETTESGRLEVRGDGLELYGRESRLSIPLRGADGSGDLARGISTACAASPCWCSRPGAARGSGSASLEGAGALHELAARLPYPALSAVAALDGM